ncbi:MAG: serine/threonine protein kinase [Kofleriaceae bacterium]|nr:serine/threonine protein kinase [Kofleriaceae bacterium]
MSGTDTKVIRGGSESAPVARPHPPDTTQFVPDLPRFGRFQTTAELGAGAMGTVFRAHDDALGRDVAIKALSAGNDAGIRERFLREARAIGAVHHPNILAIYDASTEGDTPYIVMELATAGALWDRVRAGRVDAETVRQVGIQIGRALAAAHAANILHRDVKPANILGTALGVWKLADFGIARLPDSTLTATGQFLGSPSYAAPESLQKGEFSPASDVYALGVTLYEALAGTPPHGDHDMRSLMRKLSEDPPPVQTRVAVPGPLGAAIMAALARDPGRRPSAEQLASMLAATEHASAPPAASRDMAVAPVATRGWTHKQKLVVAAIAVLALLFIIWRERDRPVPAAAANAHAPDATADEGEEISEPDLQQPTVLDQYGNPVDEETARQVLEQLQHEGRGRGRGKHHRN